MDDGCLASELHTMTRRIPRHQALNLQVLQLQVAGAQVPNSVSDLGKMLPHFTVAA